MTAHAEIGMGEMTVGRATLCLVVTTGSAKRTMGVPFGPFLVAGAIAARSFE